MVFKLGILLFELGLLFRLVGYTFGQVKVFPENPTFLMYVLFATCLGAIELKLVNLHMYSVNSQPELSEGRLLPIHSSTVFTAAPIGW